MKKLFPCLALFVATSAWSAAAQAQSACAATTYSSGASTTMDQLYKSECAVYGWDGGLITKNFTANCCITSIWIRVNYNDWYALQTAGKLDGLRYQRVINNSDGSTSISFRKINSTGFTAISSEDFSK